jgi:hypothetical protein
MAPSTCVLAVDASGSVGRQPKSERLLEGSLTTTRDLRPSLMVVERAELELIVPSLDTSQTGPAPTVLGSTVVPGGQPGTAAPVGVP